MKRVEKSKVAKPIEFDLGSERSTFLKNKFLPLDQLVEIEKNEPGLLSKIWTILKDGSKLVLIVIKILYFYIKARQKMKSDKKTTIWSILAGLIIAIAGVLGIDLDAEISSNLGGALQILAGLVMTIWGYFSKDKDDEKKDKRKTE